MSKMTARWLCALPRRLQRYLIEVSIIATVLIVIVTVIEWNRWAATSRLHYDSEEDSSFYHFYEGLGDGKPSVLVEYSDTEWKDLVKDGRRRTLNTSEGLITVKDMMLVPKYPLPNGANLYKSMASSLGEDIGNGKDSPPRGLDNLQGARRSSAVFPQGNSNCTVLPCTEYLSDEDAEHFQQCSKISMIDGDDDELLATCSFRPPDPKLPLVALASSPGSGMDLLRWFLQEVTGFCTGSVQCNTKLRMAGYVGESLQTTAVLGVKMDKVDPLWNVDMETSRSRGQDVMHTFDSAVYLLRNPFHTILEEWNQQQADLGEFSVCAWACPVIQLAVLHRGGRGGGGGGGMKGRAAVSRDPPASSGA